MSPRRIAGYDVVAVLGEGGMGVVYKAYDARLDRHLALKLLKEDGGPGAAARLEQDARAAARVEHPNVVAIYGLHELPDGLCIAMEFVDGASLRSRLAHGPIPADEAATIARGIASALAGIHGAGIVHRDLKPDNVLLARDGRVKVVDFG